MNKSIVSIVLASTVLFGCEDLQPKEWSESKHIYEFDKFKTEHYNLISRMEIGNTIFSFDSNDNRDLNIDGYDAIDGTISLRGVADSIVTWSASCNSNSCTLRFRNGERNSANVIGLTMSPYKLGKVGEMIKGSSEERESFIPITINAYSYMYNKYGFNDTLDNNFVDFSFENGKLIYKPKNDQESFVSLTPDAAYVVGDQIVAFVEAVNSYF